MCWRLSINLNPPIPFVWFDKSKKCVIREAWRCRRAPRCTLNVIKKADDIISAPEHARRRHGEYRVWSAAASTGEEPYSIAITLADALGMAPGRWKVFASDIDTEVLEKARSGIYRLSELKTLSPQQLQRYFMRGTGPHEGLVRVRQELANYVEFSSVNLLEKQYNVPGPFDAIFCRNVMIYFDKTTQEDILRRFVPLLKPDGLLFAGHSENFSNLVSRV